MLPKYYILLFNNHDIIACTYNSIPALKGAYLLNQILVLHPIPPNSLGSKNISLLGEREREKLFQLG